MGVPACVHLSPVLTSAKQLGVFIGIQTVCRSITDAPRQAVLKLKRQQASAVLFKLLGRASHSATGVSAGTGLARIIT